MEKIKIKVETVTPLYTGNAFGNMSEIEPQSIIGSLRFWFGTYLKAAKLNSNFDYTSEEFNAEDYKVDILKFINNEMSLKNAKIKSISKLQLPSLIFGCNGLKGLIEIDKINFDKNNIKNHYFSNQLKIQIGSRISKWYLPNKYFVGTFDVIFKIEDNDTTEKIFYPLLNFIENYGYLGGKNNLGFGRVKFSLENKTLNSFDDFDFSDYTNYNNLSNIGNAVKKVGKIEDLYFADKIGVYRVANKQRINIFDIIKELLAQKAQTRAKFKNDNPNLNDLRHYIFGKEKGYVNATKIIPWINKINDNNYEYGFISIVFLDKDKLSEIKEKVNQNG